MGEDQWGKPSCFVDGSPWVAFPSNTFGLNVVDASHASLNALIVWRNLRGFTPSSFSASSSKEFASALVVRLMKYSPKRVVDFASNICHACMPGCFRISPPYLHKCDYGNSALHQHIYRRLGSQSPRRDNCVFEIDLQWLSRRTEAH